MVKKILSDIHRYWFGVLATPNDTVAKEMAKKWFTRSDETDAHIRETFGKYIGPAAETEWDLNNLTRIEQVGLVILLDQFPRNIHRQSGEAFACDAKARKIVRGLLQDDPRRFYPPERPFVFLPLMHSEDVEDQDLCVMLCAADALGVPPQFIEGARSTLDFATKHRDIIRKFGRFPHRNADLGRESTPEETEFLKSGRGF